MIVEINGRQYIAMRYREGYEIHGYQLRGGVALGFIHKNKAKKWKVKGMTGEWDTMKDAVQFLVVNQPMTGPLFNRG